MGQGQPENDKRLTSVHYWEICKSELRRSDRRAAMCVENIFFKTKKLRMKIILGKSQIALRKCKSNTTALNAGVLKQQGAVERLIHLDEGFIFLRASSGSPPLLQESKERFVCNDKTVGSCNSLLQFLVCRKTYSWPAHVPHGYLFLTKVSTLN